MWLTNSLHFKYFTTLLLTLSQIEEPLSSFSFEESLSQTITAWYTTALVFLKCFSTPFCAAFALYDNFPAVGKGVFLANLVNNS